MSKIDGYLTSEMPVERLFSRGVESLSEAELLSLILGTGTKNEDVVEFSRRLLFEYKGLHSMLNIEPEEFMTVKGIGRTKAARLAAVFQIAKKLSSTKPKEKQQLNRPELIFEYVRTNMSFQDREHFLVLALNSRYEIIHKHLVSIGTDVKTFAEPREVFKMPVKLGAAYIAVCHNHPSGHILPSKEDISLTKRLSEAGSVLGITLIDHLIIGFNEYYSMKEQGDM